MKGREEIFFHGFMGWGKPHGLLLWATPQRLFWHLNTPIVRLCPIFLKQRLWTKLRPDLELDFSSKESNQLYKVVTNLIMYFEPEWKEMVRNIRTEQWKCAHKRRQVHDKAAFIARIMTTQPSWVSGWTRKWEYYIQPATHPCTFSITFSPPSQYISPLPFGW